MLDSIAYQNGQWISFGQLRFAPTDVGPAVGAIVVERLRTFDGRVHALDLHLERLQQSVRALRCAEGFCKQAWTQVVAELISRNQSAIADEQDVSIVVLVSPGERHGSHVTPTTMAYIEALPKSVLSKRYAEGVPLVLSTVRNIPSSCWPTTIKVRSRLQYYLADHEANDLRAGSLALLLDQNGNVTETSIACPVLCIGGKWVCPPADSMLPSVTMQFYQDRLRNVLELHSRPIALEELPNASEILLLGTTSQIYAANSLDLTLHGLNHINLDGTNGAGYQQILRTMIDRLEFDFAAARHGS